MTIVRTAYFLAIAVIFGVAADFFATLSAYGASIHTVEIFVEVARSDEHVAPARGVGFLACREYLVLPDRARIAHAGGFGEGLDRRGLLVDRIDCLPEMRIRI